MFWNRKKKEKRPVIENAGASVCTKSILNKDTPLMWCVREEPIHEADNGWRFVGKDDSEIYLKDADNSTVVDFNKVAEIEPAIIDIYDMPIGTDLFILRDEEDKVHYFDTLTREEIEVN